MLVPSGTASPDKELVVVENYIGVKSFNDANSVYTIRVEFLALLLLF